MVTNKKTHKNMKLKRLIIKHKINCKYIFDFTCVAVKIMTHFKTKKPYLAKSRSQ